ncbi:hypothetical protein E0H56_30965 [Rhizobium leguminosarum bv. viciae]|nr:hypothetical protein E0H44_25630 [Rhizobium leguminosarum bv. viciae]TBZ61751.1 hypothetical protein E0H64_30335 [Rhizobium leguminosarum bv. viciae]TBZ75426.1 hypothetical protein E0H61_26010 [Rhizobium leguminosarum bv. viciae]TBZ83788.1 hypothetical protein E0H56_30965 [Rhizobium leguminosarum bv. viciae]TCA09957.1 hypothetical protein E0H68_25125 [Rhizobium leguminosarum bv. viciae]
MLVGDASIPVAGGTRDAPGQIGRVVAPAASTAADILRGRFLKQLVPAGQLAGQVFCAGRPPRPRGIWVKAFTSSTHYVSVLGKDASPRDYPVR